MKGIHRIPHTCRNCGNACPTLDGPVEDDAKESVELLVWHRIPWLVIGLIGGVIASFMVSRFEAIISENIALAFFLPLVVYMSDAVGTQAETVYVRNLALRKVKFGTYFFKELAVGITMGLFFGTALGYIAYTWIGSLDVAFTVGIALGTSMTISPVVALLMPTFLSRIHKDPALGAGPFTTIVQDLISVFIYFAIASYILF